MSNILTIEELTKFVVPDHALFYTKEIFRNCIDIDPAWMVEVRKIGQYRTLDGLTSPAEQSSAAQLLQFEQDKWQEGLAQWVARQCMNAAPIGIGTFMAPALLSDRRANDQSVQQLVTVCADFDTGNPAEQLEALSRALGARPTFVCTSGGITKEGHPKLHTHWRLDEPCSEPWKVAYIREQLALRFGADASFKRIPQVIRIPGALYDKHGQWGTTLIVEHNDIDVGLMQWEEALSLDWHHIDQGSVHSPSRKQRSKEERAERQHALQTEIVEEGRVVDTRWDRFSEYAGHQIRQARFQHQTVEEALQSVKLWVRDKMVPAWEEDRVEAEFKALLQRDRLKYQEAWGDHCKPPLALGVLPPTNPFSQTNDNDEWPPLTPLDAPYLPSMPIDCLPSWAGEFARALSKATETPLELPTAMVLATCAAAVARRYKVHIEGDYYEPTNLWIAVALQPGSRKSAVQSAAVKPFYEWETQQAAMLQPQIEAAFSERQTVEARLKQLRKAASRAKADEVDAIKAQITKLETSLPPIKHIPRLWTSDSTPERLGTLLGQHFERMAWLSSEGGIFDILKGRYTGGALNLDLVLKSHSGDAERVDRGGREPLLLENPLLTIGLSPQPDLLHGLANTPGFRGRGLLARFLYLIPASILGYRTLKSDPIPISVKYAYKEGILKLLSLADGQHTEVLELSVGAYAKWDDYRHRIEKCMRPAGEFEQALDWAGKAPGAAARIAGVLHSIENAHCSDSKQISAETMSSAVQIMEIFGAHSLYAFDIMGIDETIADARYVWDWLVKNRLGTFSVTHIQQKLKSRFQRVKRIELALEVLFERGYIMGLPLPTQNGPGRPASPQFQVRPELTENWS